MLPFTVVTYNLPTSKEHQIDLQNIAINNCALFQVNLESTEERLILRKPIDVFFTFFSKLNDIVLCFKENIYSTLVYIHAFISRYKDNKIYIVT